MSKLVGRGIVKTYGKKTVLQDVNLMLGEHKIYGMIGRNGAGKTTLLSILTAQNPATAAKGINILVEAGIVYKKRGIGMFVAKGAKEVIQKKRKDAFYQDYIASMLAEAQSLGITKKELVQMIMEGK